ncbi:SET and MYND domain-containing protein 4-like [Coccinella septempunctata]|uniref:SET and MYND domain-containing protein 4-like n=1 Tax=Coccinella septempunctata TaxID=41139 RepID=UPI001D06E7FB|nr:SET and MYND domain-containing protein 4-like [Coccinella septempunctata]
MNNEQRCMENEDIFEKLTRVIRSSDNDLNGGITKQFLNLKTLTQEVDFILELLSKYNISLHYIRDSKNNKKSSDLRISGNKLFSVKKDEDALKMYTYSIAFAEDKSEYLGLAYANRSAVLFRLGFFEECLKDIERALENNYPITLKQKINERKEKALCLKSKQKSLKYYQNIPSIDVNEKNPLIECASNSVELRNDPKQGRFIVATKDIQIGEIIAVEHPTFTVLTDARWCHCYHCLTLCYNLLPCKTCTKALFCSSNCRVKSNYYHKYECPVLATIESLGYNQCRFLPLRVAISMKEHFATLEELELEKLDSVYKSGRYKELHHLVTNQQHRTPSDIFERVTCTALFFKLLKEHTDFFESDDDAKLIFDSLLFQHLQTMACNFHDINELSLNSDGIYESTQLGAGAYNFLSLFNHSCNPNVCRTSYGTTEVVSAVRTIRKGEQLFDNYGFHYGIHPKSMRQASLKKQYHFDCNCQACSNNWATVQDLKHKDEPFHFVEYHESLANAVVEVAKKIRPSVIKALQELEKNIPCFEFCQVQEILKQCDGIFGNVRRCLNSDSFT